MLLATGSSTRYTFFLLWIFHNFLESRTLWLCTIFLSRELAQIYSFTYSFSPFHTLLLNPPSPFFAYHFTSLKLLMYLMSPHFQLRLNTTSQVLLGSVSTASSLAYSLPFLHVVFWWCYLGYEFLESWSHP